MPVCAAFGNSILLVLLGCGPQPHTLLPDMLQEGDVLTTLIFRPAGHVKGV